MSELYMIILQGKEELGNDPDAIRLWAELSGVDINSIKEDTPFDIDIADRLLRTLPEVIERIKEKKRSEIEGLSKSLETIISEKKGVPRVEEVFEVIKEEVEKPAIFEEILSEERKDFPEQTRFVFVFSEGKIQKMFGSWDKIGEILPILQKNLKSFHLEYPGELIVYGERVDKRWIVAGFEERNLGVARILFSIVDKEAIMFLFLISADSVYVKVFNRTLGRFVSDSLRVEVAGFFTDGKEVFDTVEIKGEGWIRIPKDPHVVGLTVIYKGERFPSQPIILNDTSRSITVEVYDVSGDRSDISVVSHNLGIFKEEGVYHIVELVEFKNSSNMAFRGPILEVKLPKKSEGFNITGDQSDYFQSRPEYNLNPITLARGGKLWF